MPPFMTGDQVLEEHVPPRTAEQMESDRTIRIVFSPEEFDRVLLAAAMGYPHLERFAKRAILKSAEAILKAEGM